MFQKRKKQAECFLAMILLVCFYVLSRKATEASAEQEAKVIVVDPGHGGEDPGMIGIDGIQEKKINLEIAMRLKACLEEHGFQVVMTREEDRGLYQEESKNHKAEDLQERIRIVEKVKPLLAISIHQNSYEDPKVKGPQVFYYKDSAQGQKLAQCIQNAMNGLPGVEKPRVEKGNTSYYLLKRSDTVMNIVECGFLTNREETERLKNAEYQKQAAEAVTAGILAFLEE